MKKIAVFIVSLLCSIMANAADATLSYNGITVNIDYANKLTYSITYNGKQVIQPSRLGFKLRDEQPLDGGFSNISTEGEHTATDAWTPAVRNKHASISLQYKEQTFALVEQQGQHRRLDITFRIYNDAVTFRYKLYSNEMVGNRLIEQEMTEFRVPDSSTAWVGHHQGLGYHGSYESTFSEQPVNSLSSNDICLLPFLVKENADTWIAIQEAAVTGYPGFYISRDENLTCRLSPLLDDTTVCARFDDTIQTPWRIINIASNPGRFIESETARSVNPPCKLTDTSWIKPGISAWDHWWSGEVSMEQDTIYQYIDLAAEMGWPYMLIDWTWYGPYNKPEADVTTAAPQLNMPEILAYARKRNVKIWLWMYVTDVNRNDTYRDAFALYEKWGIAGIKIDFMDRNDQPMTEWYERVTQCAAEHHLMLDFHGAYPPNGFDRTYPHQLTREGVYGEENTKWSRNITPQHNVTLAFTRMLAGAMDYTPGGFLNVTPEQFKQQSPTLVMNSRTQELAKFVVYESPFTVYCDAPRNIIGQPGSEFLRNVPVEWDDIHVLGGAPDDYIAIAKRSGDKWYIAVINGKGRRNISLDLSPLNLSKKAEIEEWADTKQTDSHPTLLRHSSRSINTTKQLNISLARGGGYVGIIK